MSLQTQKPLLILVSVVERSSQNKQSPFLKPLKNISQYVAVDINDAFLKTAQKIIGSNFDKKLKFLGINEDFEAMSPIAKHGKALGLFFGASTNFEEFPEGMLDLLKSFKRAIGKGGNLVMTIDTNTDPKSVIQSYNHPLHAEQIANLMHRITRDIAIEGDFDPYAWHYETDTKPMTYKGHDLLLTGHVLVAEKPMSFFIDGEHFTIKEGERLVVDQSYKISVDLMDVLCEMVGLTRVSRYDDSDNRMALLAYNIN